MRSDFIQDTPWLFALLVLLLIALGIMLFLLHMHRKRKRILARIAAMEQDEKCTLMNSLVEELGYEYVCPTDIFSTTLDAWQKQFGYTALFDAGAARFNMIFDCEPLYFDYRGKTWLIELWKGQYGINVGGEVGVYYSDRLLRPEEYATEVFKVVEPQDMLDMSMILEFHGYTVRLSRKHWWLTAFCMGKFSQPNDIIMKLRLQFPDLEMLQAFRNALLTAGYAKEDVCSYGTELYITFVYSHTQHYGFVTRLRRSLVQLQNRFFCHLFLHVTQPLTSSVDQLLFLYYHLPFIFRHTMRLRRFRKGKS